MLVVLLITTLDLVLLNPRKGMVGGVGGINLMTIGHGSLMVLMMIDTLMMGIGKGTCRSSSRVGWIDYGEDIPRAHDQEYMTLRW